jgi:hypothetical protein
MASSAVSLDADDQALLDRVATRVVELRMETPAILALETGRPLSVLAGQTLYFFEPFVTAFLNLPDYRRFAALIERREHLETLARLIEEKADAEHLRRRAQAAEKKAAKRAAKERAGAPRSSGADPSA